MEMIQKNSEIYLYGAASIGMIVYNKLVNKGVNICGFIDKRAKEIQSFCGLPVYEIEDKRVVRTAIVYVSVKNVFEHEEIKNRLVDEGFKYIIYKPFNAILGIGTNEENEISDWYDTLFEGHIPKNRMLLEIDELKKECVHDYAIISDEGEKLIAYIPVEFIFTNNYPETSLMNKWGNVPVQAFFTHINFFRYLNGAIDSAPEDYLKEYCEYTAKIQNTICITDAWRENVLRNRTQIYEQMRESLELDPDFFKRNAATAEWNQKGYFNLTSGKHRVTFFAALGRRYIPLEIKWSDYNKYLNKEKLKKVYDALVNREEKYVYIPHPQFYRGCHNRDDGTGIFIQWLLRVLGKQAYLERGKIEFSEYSIVDQTNDNGYSARYLARCGFRVYRNIRPSSLELALNELFLGKANYCTCPSEPQLIIVEENQDLVNSLVIGDTSFKSDVVVRNLKKDRYCNLLNNCSEIKNNMKIVNNVQHSSKGMCVNVYIHISEK